MSQELAKTASQTPLRSIAAAVVDTETTGLNTSLDRILQIGAVRLDKGMLSTVDEFDQLVNPGQAISASSSAIHKIFDADVAQAPSIDTVLPTFFEWCGSAVIIGFSIGFDLAVLKAECARAGVRWQAPRSLDVGHLVHIISPNLPDYSLDTVAHYLDITTDARHNALADATMTAQVFLELVPRLRNRGIRTLAEAETACLSLGPQLTNEVKAGWHEMTGPGVVTPGSISALARIDSFPYRHRIGDIMHSPAKVVSPDTGLSDVLAMLMNEQVSSVFIDPRNSDEAYGIVTERDILRVLNSNPAGALEMLAGDVAVRPLVSIPVDEFVYRAIGRMASSRFRHLGVHDSDGKIVGAISARDLLRQRASDAISLGDEMETAHTLEDLGVTWTKLTLVARSLAYEEVDPRDIAAIISHELRALTQRACEIAEAEMLEAGEGSPPRPYAMMVLGSGGRGESLLAMDQDNAIIFDEGDPGGDADLWFATLGARVSEILNTVGVEYCKGGIMAANAEWRMSASNWREAISTWISRSAPQDIMNTDIFFDSLPVHGERTLAEKLHADAVRAAANARTYLQLLSRNAADINLPLGWFGRFQLDEGRMDLKMGGIMPIFSAARVLALKNGLSERSTPDRLEAIRDKGVANSDQINNLIDAHRILLGAILHQQLRDLETGTPLSNKVAPKGLSGHEREEIKWALETAGTVPGLLGDPIPVA